MTNAQIINSVAEHVRKKFETDASGHDWWHMYRVWQISKHIMQSEPKADPFITELGALLHDIADFKFHDGDLQASPRAARALLEPLGVDEKTVKHVQAIVGNVSYKGANIPSNMSSIEGWIVHDADKIDAMGAIGIARTFAYGGANGREMYNPERPPEDYADFEAYRTNNNPTINHFHEKLLLLKERMHTAEGKRLAQARHDYMVQFLDEFHAEWDGKR